jgi:glycosyltransferase involved in cell wall biosynthesis
MRERIPATAVVVTKNEERNIAKCLRSLGRFDQVFVVDSHSDDATTAIASSLGAAVVEFAWDGRHPKKKQWCLEHLPFAHDWVLFLDADEELTPELGDEIASLLADRPAHAGYFLGYDYAFLGRVLRHGHRVYKLVLFDRTRARFPDLPDLDVAAATDQELHVHPQVDGTTGTLRRRALHADHDTLFHYFDRHNRYSDWEAVLRRRGVLPIADEAQPGIRKLLKRAFNRVPFKGTIAFADTYLLKAGFLDGRAGLDYAIARGFYYWQIRAKTLELELAGSSRAALEVETS